jgi:hypothetical protein
MPQRTGIKKLRNQIILLAAGPAANCADEKPEKRAENRRRRKSILTRGELAGDGILYGLVGLERKSNSLAYGELKRW